jgi:hypothetical protein
MGSIRTCVTLLFALTLSLAATAVAQPLSGPEFIPLATPCRALDTRIDRFFGAPGPPLDANVPRTIQIGGNLTGGPTICGVPTTAVGAALNFTITQPQGPGWLTAWPSGALPATSTVNFVAGQNVANAVDIGLGPGGTVIVQPTVATHLVVDVYGYFIDVEVAVAGGNTALGRDALAQSTGGGNTAIGFVALQSNITGSNNTALGNNALANITSGSNNTAIGAFAGGSVVTGSNNIHIGHTGSTADTGVIRIGSVDPATQTATFIAGISGVPVAGVPVMVAGNGQLGVAAASSRRVKDDIHDMDDASGGLGKLRPGTFRYNRSLPMLASDRVRPDRRGGGRDLP